MSNAPDPPATNRTEDVTSPEEQPELGSETGRQSLYFGANLPGMLGAAGILVTNPQSLGAFGIGSLAFGGGAAAAGYLGGPALLGQGFTGGLTPADISGSVYGFSSILPGYGSTAPGTYLTYRLMRNNPTVAIARLAATAPIRAADISVDGPDATDEQIEFISSIIQPLWAGFLRDALFALDYGWKGFEKVYAVEGGYTVLKRLKPLGVDITMIRWDEATGSFAGIEQQDVKLPPDKCFVWSYDQEDDAYYGRSRHENIRGVWWAWIELLRKEGQYLSKVAGVTPIMKYPEGSGRDASGALRPNFELAQQALCLLGRGNGIAMPNRVASWARELVRTGIDVSQLASWQLEFLEPKGEHGQDFILQMQHKESLMLRGWLVPERAVAEGKYGTKAEAETHTDLAVAIAQHDLFDLLRCVNESIIDPLLALNFGPEARGLVTVTASPLVDDKAVLARNIVQAVLTAPNNADLALKVLDFDQMLEQQGLPTSGVGTEEALAEQKQNAPGPAPGPAPGSVNGTPGGRPPGGAGMGVPPSTDGQMAELAHRLARVRELSRWTNARSGGRARSLTATTSRRPTPRTYAGPMELAGFRPDQLRDQRGQWTKEADVSQAVPDSAQDAVDSRPAPSDVADQEKRPIQGNATTRPSTTQPGLPVVAAQRHKLTPEELEELKRLLRQREDILGELAHLRPSKTYPGNEDRMRELRQELNYIEHQINALQPGILNQRPTYPRGGETDTDPVRQRQLDEIQQKRDALLQLYVREPWRWLEIQHEIDELNAKQNLLQHAGDIGVRLDKSLYPKTGAGKGMLDRYDQREQRQKEIAAMGNQERLKELLTRLYESGKLPEALADRVKQLLEPKNLAIFAAITAGAIASQAAGVGEIADVVAAVLLGSDAAHVGGKVATAIVGALQAHTDEDFDRAADDLADGLSLAALDLGLMVAGTAAGKAVGKGWKSLKPVRDALVDRFKKWKATADEPGGSSGGGTVREGGSVPPMRARLKEYFRRLEEQPPSTTAEDALHRIRDTLDAVEDEHSGVSKKDPPPPPDKPDGRMYPPLDDNVTRNPDGSITARTRGHKIEIGADGSIIIRNSTTGEVDFQQRGGGN